MKKTDVIKIRENLWSEYKSMGKDKDMMREFKEFIGDASVKMNFDYFYAITKGA